MDFHDVNSVTVVWYRKGIVKALFKLINQIDWIRFGFLAIKQQIPYNSKDFKSAN